MSLPGGFHPQPAPGLPSSWAQGCTAGAASQPVPGIILALQHLLPTLAGTLEGLGSSVAMSGTSGNALGSSACRACSLWGGTVPCRASPVWGHPHSWHLRYCPAQRTAKYEVAPESKYTLSGTLKEREGSFSSHFLWTFLSNHSVPRTTNSPVKHLLPTALCSLLLG